MKSPLLSLPGAVPAEGPDEGVAAHYGALFREQRALADGTGFVDLSHRGVLTVTGDDRLSWLHLLITQHVSELPAGRATEALVLTANGHIEHALYLVDDGTTTWVHVEPGTQGALLAYLESMKFFYRVEAADRTEEFALVHLPAGSIVSLAEGEAAALPGVRFDHAAQCAANGAISLRLRPAPHRRRDRAGRSPAPVRSPRSRTANLRRTRPR